MALAAAKPDNAETESDILSQWVPVALQLVGNSHSLVTFADQTCDMAKRLCVLGNPELVEKLSPLVESLDAGRTMARAAAEFPVTKSYMEKHARIERALVAHAGPDGQHSKAFRLQLQKAANALLKAAQDHNISGSGELTPRSFREAIILVRQRHGLFTHRGGL